jgi:hypothetical protein
VIVANNAEIKDVPVSPGENVIKLTLLDSNQNPVAGATNEISIFRTAARAEGIKREELYLEAKFADAYRQYKSQVPRYGWPWHGIDHHRK